MEAGREADCIVRYCHTTTLLLVLVQLARLRMARMGTLACHYVERWVVTSHLFLVLSPEQRLRAAHMMWN